MKVCQVCKLHHLSWIGFLKYTNPKYIIKCFGINWRLPETHFRKPNEVSTELTKNGINCTNINKLLANIQIR